MTVLKEEIESVYFLGGIYSDIQNRFENLNHKKTMDGFLFDLEEDHQTYFNEQKSSTGEPWAELKESTKKAKGHDKILFEFGDLEKSLVGQGTNSIRLAGEEGLIFGSSDPKAWRHQEGNNQMPARPPVGVTNERLDAMANAVADQIVLDLRYTL